MSSAIRRWHSGQNAYRKHGSRRRDWKTLARTCAFGWRFGRSRTSRHHDEREGMWLRMPQRGDCQSRSRKPERARARGNSEDDLFFTRSGLRALSQTCPCIASSAFQTFRHFLSKSFSLFMNVFFTDVDRLAILLIGYARAARSVISLLFGSK